MFQCKIWSLGRSKSAKNPSIWSLCFPVSPLCAATPRSATRRRRHASAVAANLVPREPSYPLPVPSLSEPFPSPSSRPRQAEPERAVIVAVAAPTTPLLSRSIPRVPIAPSLIPNLSHLSPSSAVPFPRPNRARRPRLPLLGRRELRPVVDLRPPGLLRPNRLRGELVHDLLSLLDLFIARISHHRRRSAAALPRTPCSPPAHAAGPPCSSSRSAAARPGPAQRH